MSLGAWSRPLGGLARAAAHPASRAVPPVGWVAVVLVAYALVLVPAVLWGLRRIGRGNAAWVVLPLLALGFAAGLWFLGRHAPGSPAAAGVPTRLATPRLR